MIALGPARGARIAVVGACGGIGRAVVAGLRGLGVEPIGMDLPASGQGVIPIDVTDRDSVHAAFAGMGPLQGLVNLAGFTAAKQPVGGIDPAVWAGVVDANLTGAFHVAQAALPLLRAGGSAAAPM